VQSELAIDLSPYICRGFPGEFDAAMADVPVRGIDREQTLSMVRLCRETEPILYGPTFSPRRIRYIKSARPELERIASHFDGSPRDRVLAAMNWTADRVVHAHFIGPVPPDRAMDEESLIGSRGGWCNEQVRVFIALCEVMEIAARLCFLFHANGHTAHTASEVLLDDRWAMHDVTYRVRVQLPDGKLAEARDLQGKHRALAHAAYRAPLTDYYARGVNSKADRAPSPDTGGDFFHAIGICNYLIQGVEVVQE
jgi:transglutaminase-like putative cysteine protease